jgi:hypothetical protein
MQGESVVSGDFILQLRKREDFEKYRKEIFHYIKVKKRLYKKIKPLPQCLAMYNDVVNYLKVKGWVSQDELDRL